MSHEHPPVFISIILPTYNVGRYIERALESCRNQTYPNLEIIVVDDCGSDDSIARTRRVQQVDHRIRLTKNPRNMGTFHARWRGAQIARGDYVIFLDPDDTLDLRTCELLAECALTRKSDVIFYGKKVFRYKANGAIKTRVIPAITARPALLAGISRSLPKDLGTPGKAYRTPVLIDAFSLLSVPPTERLVYGEDALLFYAVLCVAQSGASVDGPLYHYYLNDTSISTQRTIESVQSQQRQLDTIVKLLAETAVKIAPTGAAHIPLLTSHFAARLSSDKWMLARHTLRENGEDQYFRCVRSAWHESNGAVEFRHLLLYILSFGLIRR